MYYIYDDILDTFITFSNTNSYIYYSINNYYKEYNNFNPLDFYMFFEDYDKNINDCITYKRKYIKQSIYTSNPIKKKLKF